MKVNLEKRGKDQNRWQEKPENNDNIFVKFLTNFLLILHGSNECDRQTLKSFIYSMINTIWMKNFYHHLPFVKKYLHIWLGPVPLIFVFFVYPNIYRQLHNKSIENTQQQQQQIQNIRKHIRYQIKSYRAWQSSSMHRCFYFCVRFHSHLNLEITFRKKNSNKFNSVHFQMCGNSITYRFAIIVSLISVSIHFRFATNEQRIYVLWIYLDSNSKIYHKHLFTFSTAISLSSYLKQSQRLKESKVFLSSCSSIKF